MPSRPRGAARRTGSENMLLGQFDQAVQVRAAAGQDQAGGNHARRGRRACSSSRTSVSNSCARGSMISLSMRAKTVRGGRSPTLAISMALIFADQFAPDAAVLALDFFRFGNRRAQADGKVVGEMIAADGQGRGVAHHAAGEDDQFRGAAADIEQAAAQFALVLREDGFGGGQRLERGVGDHHAGAIDGGDHILRGRRRGGDDVHVDFELLPDHADGIANVVLRVDAEIPAGARAGLRGLRAG